MQIKLWSLVLSGVLLVGTFTPTVRAAQPPSSQNSVKEGYAAQRTERVVRAYNMKYYPTRASIPATYYYNDGTYAGSLNITVVISYTDGAGDWWGVTYEGPVYPIN